MGPPPANRGGDGPRPGSDLRHLAPKTLRSRPIYPYPTTTSYVGHGDANDPASFRAGGSADMPVSGWLGESFFTPGYELSCGRDAGGLKCVQSGVAGK